MISSLITLLSMPGGSEWIIIALVVLLLFGGKKIPELMKGMGKGVRSFKEGMNEVSNELKDASDKTNENSSENSSK
jgi:sec-independent protein translocase protein TatA